MLIKFDDFVSKDLIYFLLESRGISDSVIEIRDILKKDMSSFINKSKTDTYFKNPIFKNYKRINISNNNEFKIKNCFLDINLIRYKENNCNGEVNVKQAKIVNGYIENSIIKLDIYFNKFDDDFIFKIYSILLHELVHLYEHYNLLLNKKFRPQYWSIGSIYKQLRNNYKNTDILYILNLLYKSLRNEISSNLHQYYDYKKYNKNYNELFNIINDLKSFDINKLNIDDNFIKELNSVRNHIYNSIKYFITNKYYLKDLNSGLWKNEINENNIMEFLLDLKELFNISINYINKKIILINNKLNEIRYDGYKNILTENINNNNFEVLFFN